MIKNPWVIYDKKKNPWVIYDKESLGFGLLVGQNMQCLTSYNYNQNNC